MNKQNFNTRCYELISRIPAGRVTTYKNVAQALNCKAYRAVGNAMNKNPFAPRVPCHRVVSSDGSLGGYALGAKAKITILKEENISVKAGKIIDFDQKFFDLTRVSK